MEIVYLTENEPLPEPDDVQGPGLVAAGGSLCPEKLIESYSKGIFPWYSEGEPVLWWSPDPRMILFPENIHISGSMKKLIKKNRYRVTVNRDFDSVIRLCRETARRDEGTWITAEMKTAYLELHRLGFAHSVEVWNGEKMAGGLYGVSFNRMFFGESMFFTESNASKYGFIFLARHLAGNNFRFIDCQIDSGHLRSLGAECVSRSEFLRIIRTELSKKKPGKSIFPDELFFG